MVKDGPKDPNVFSLMYGELYCKKFVGHVRGLEKHKCVRWKVWLRLSSIGGGMEWWLCKKRMLQGLCMDNVFM